MTLKLDGTGAIIGVDQGLNVVGIVTARSGIHVTGGSVGIGTDNPLTKTHIDGTNGDNSTLFITASDLGADYGGTISLGGNYDGTNKTAFSQIKGLKDNNTSGQYGGYLSFLTRAHGGSPSERLRISSGGNIGIATDNPDHAFHLYSGLLGIGKSAITGFEITLDNNNLTFSRDSKSYINQKGTGTISVRLGPSYTEVAEFTSDGLKLPSGNGIDFSATSDGGTSTPSELLDDYEEGSFDPEILGWNGSYSIQEGRYIKIGRKVHVLGEVRSDANAGNSFTNAWPGLSNLPFVNTTSFQGVSGSQRHMGTGTILGDVSPGGTNGQAFVTFDRNTGSNAFFPNNISSQGAQNFQNTMINNPTTVDFGYRFNCTFYTD